MGPSRALLRVEASDTCARVFTGAASESLVAARELSVDRSPARRRLIGARGSATAAAANEMGSFAAGPPALWLEACDSGCYVGRSAGYVPFSGAACPQTAARSQT
ncbi:unnamed protein product [Hyaloperonospora brassicae]|uniref:RxLR effector candidate protein n=1 Tax=Hyaloperonospora brassicae TaxID=162125 RepID=A0AAV0TIS2_HYABA|nr:unnamed protein product [Hyaloperonospora brassicae]